MKTGKIQKIKVYRRKCKEFHIVVLSDNITAYFTSSVTRGSFFFNGEAIGFYGQSRDF